MEQFDDQKFNSRPTQDGPLRDGSLHPHSNQAFLGQQHDQFGPYALQSHQVGLAQLDPSQSSPYAYASSSNAPYGASTGAFPHRSIDGPMDWHQHQAVPDWLLHQPQQQLAQSHLPHPAPSPADGSSAWGGAYLGQHAAYGPSGSAWPGSEPSSISSSARLKPFIEKLYSILAQPAHFRDCLVWDEAGSCFIVSHANPRLLTQVLPDAFGHSNLHSFTRQLNIYGFTRCTSAELLTKLDVTSTSDFSGWRHPLFSRGNTSSLHLLTPRPSRARQAKKEEKAAKEQEKLAASAGPGP